MFILDDFNCVKLFKFNVNFHQKIFFFYLACDYLGERMASLFGITSAKYQYAIDEYYRIKKEVWGIKKYFFMLHLSVLANLDPDLCVRGKMKRRKTGCRKKRNAPWSRKKWQTRQRKRKMKKWGLVRDFLIKSKTRIALHRKPSQFPLLSRQHNGPWRASRY